MGVQVAGTWSQLWPTNSSVPYPRASGKRKVAAAAHCCDRILTPPFLCSVSGRPLRAHGSMEFRRGGRRRREETALRRILSASASLDRFVTEGDDGEEHDEFVRRIENMAVELQQQRRDSGEDLVIHSESWRSEEGDALSYSSFFCSSGSRTPSPSPPPLSRKQSVEPLWFPLRPEPPDWHDQIVPASVEKNANNVELPLSLRIIKLKKRWENSWFREAGESACCSVKRAFSSMVFMIRELQSYMLQMREVLFREELHGILARVQSEMNSSFVWLFQQIFSCTPTLMVSVMLLLANFTVYSMGNLDVVMGIGFRVRIKMIGFDA